MPSQQVRLKEMIKMVIKVIYCLFFFQKFGYLEQKL